MSNFNQRPLPGNVQDPCFTERRVVFRHPFTLDVASETYPAGSYVVETESCAYEGNEHTANVRTSTVLVLNTPTGTRDVHVNGSDLDAALRADSERLEKQDPNENPDRGEANS